MAILLCGHTTVWPHYLWPHCCMANRSSSWWCKVESSVFKTKPFLYRDQSQNYPQPCECTSTVSKWQKDYTYNFSVLNFVVCCAVLRNLLLSVPDQASIRQRSPIELKCLNLKGKCRKPHGFVCFVHFIILRKIAQICAKFQKYVQFQYLIHLESLWRLRRW